MFFIFQMMLVLRMGAGGTTDRAITSGAIYPIVFLTLSVGAAKWLQDWSNVHTLVRCLAWTGIVFLLATLYQFAINPSAVEAGGRFYGTTANPQMAGMLIAVVLPPCCFLLTVRSESKLWRIFLIGCTGFLVLFLLWTGSRTGVVMALVGITLLFRRRLGKFLLIGSATAIVVLVALQIFAESSSGAERILSAKDTRSGVWADLFDIFSNHIAWGAMKDVLEVRENSYLTTAANAGLFGLVPLLITGALGSYTLLKLQRVRRKIGEHAMLIDLVTAGICSIAVGGFFEGILLGTMTPYIFLIYIYFAIAGFIFEAAALHDQWGDYGQQQQLQQQYADEEYAPYGADDWVDADADPNAAPPEYTPPQRPQRAYPHV